MKYLLLCICLILLVSSHTTMADKPVSVSKPGNIQGSLLVESLDHILGFAIPIAGYYIWGGGTGDPLVIDYTYTGFLFSVYIGKITFDEVDVLTSASFAWNGDDGVNLTITNITTNAHIDLRFYLLWVVPIWGLRIHFKDLNITALIDFSETYNRFPQLALDLDMKFDKFDWGFFVIGWIVRLFVSEQTLINLVISSIEGAITGLNESMANQDPDSNLVNVMDDLSANIGFSMPFELDKENDLINFGLDGRIHNDTKTEYYNEVFPTRAERFSRSHSNQIFIHQSTIESAARSLMRLYLPISIEDPSFTQLLGIYLPELYDTYGKDGLYKIEADASDDFNLEFLLNQGIKVSNLGLGITIYGKKKGMFNSYKEALKFSLTLDIEEIDIHIQDLVVYTNIGKATARNSFLMSSNVGDLARNNWDQFFESLINFQLGEVNVNNKQFDIKSLDQQIDLIAGQIPNSTVAFSYQDGFAYIGLRFFNDS
jgi:hypothetical protein